MEVKPDAVFELVSEETQWRGLPRTTSKAMNLPLASEELVRLDVSN